MIDFLIRGRTRHRSFRIIGRVLCGLVTCLILLVQVCHPGIHPLEHVGHAGDHHDACPMSHVVADVGHGLLLYGLPNRGLIAIPAPLTWMGRHHLDYPLAPRPPPIR